MLQSFKDVGTEDIFNGRRTKAAQSTCPQSLWKIAARKLDQLDSVTALHELQIPPGNRLEALKGDRQGQQSIRIAVGATDVVAAQALAVCDAWRQGGPGR